MTIQHLLYERIPTPIYKFLSNQYHAGLQATLSIIHHPDFDFDPIYRAIVLGLTIGFGLVTFLEFFPGEPFSFELEKNDIDDDDNDSKSSSSNSNTNEAPPKIIKEQKDQKDEKEESDIDNEHKKTNSILSKEKLQKTKEKYGLSNQEMEKMIKFNNMKKRQQSSMKDEEEDLGLTLAQWLNLGVYTTFMIGTIYLLNRDYDSIVTLWFIRTFPREAKTLGLF
mmetsp:Transcript_2060/g.2805  ORF Transcript_2060/g.2805 Transcript_2060/m.2805 type:complete len:223 (+) Transcript_2060:116-784(+)